MRKLANGRWLHHIRLLRFLDDNSEPETDKFGGIRGEGSEQIDRTNSYKLSFGLHMASKQRVLHAVKEQCFEQSGVVTKVVDYTLISIKYFHLLLNSYALLDHTE